MTYQSAPARALPQNIEAERGLLGIILERNDVIHDITDRLTKDDFFEGKHGELFILMRDLIERGQSATPTMLLHDAGQDADIGGIMTSAYLGELVREAPPPNVARDLARTIRDLALRRRLIELSSKVAEEAYSAPATITAAEMEARYHSAASAMFSSLSEVGMRTFDEVMDATLRQISDAARSEVPIGIDLGLKALQDLTGALMAPRLISFGAVGGAGKTALALQIAKEVARTEPVAFFSIEMDAEEQAIRHVSTQTGIEGEQLERGQITPDDWTRIMEAAKAAKGLKLYMDATTAPTVGAIRGKLVRLKMKHGVKGVIVDNLLEIARDPKLSEFDGIAQIMRGLKRICKDLGIWMILLCHLKQSYISLDKIREPNDGDVYGGGAVGQVSDVEILIHNEEYMLGRRKPAHGDEAAWTKWREALMRSAGKVKFILGKRRAGKGFGERTCSYDPKTHTFTDRIDRSPEPQVAVEDEAPF